MTVFEVKREDGSNVGILYTDYFPRPGKQAGAWCGTFRGQEWRDGALVTPLVYNVGNFSKPTGDKPALLSPEEVATLLHEFGHALECIASKPDISQPQRSRRFCGTAFADHGELGFRS